MRPKEEVPFVHPPGSTCSPLMFRVLPSMLVVRKLNKRGSRAEPMQVSIHDRCFACDVANDAAGGCYDGCGAGDLPRHVSARDTERASLHT
jgi:hypothetical protein